MADRAPIFHTPPEESHGRWVPILIAAVVIGVAVAAVILFSRRPQPAAEQRIDPYAEYLQVGDLKLSGAESFVGTSVHYLDGKIANTGPRTVTGIRVEVIFRDSLGQVVLRETQNLMRLEERPGMPADLVALKAHPLQPNEVAQFRLTFEHIPAEWNRGYPELRFLQVSLQ